MNEHAEYNKFMMTADPNGDLADFSDIMDNKGAEDVFEQRSRRMEDDPDYEYKPHVALLDEDLGLHFIPELE